METIEKPIDVSVSVHAAYNQWTQFEEFPRFMKGVTEVRQLDDTHLHWKADFYGREEEWDAKITDQIPDKRIAWESTSGPYHAGVVTFHHVSDNSSRVMLQLGYNPEGFVEQIGDKMGFVAGRVEADLQRFKEFIEARGIETGGWRGAVHQETVHMEDPQRSEI